MKRMLIIGGTSAIASETAIHFVKDGWDLYLADLKLSRLQEVKNHIQSLTGVGVMVGEFLISDITEQKRMIAEVINALGGFDAALVAYGTLPEQKGIENNPELVNEQLFINFSSICNLMTIIARVFEKQGFGSLGVISSVAGDRGRQSNYIYGAAKGGLSIFLQGLRNRFGKTNIKIITIKPGFVNTPMTDNMPKNALYSSPEKVGAEIKRAFDKNIDILYVPGFWRMIMFIIKHIPETIFKRLSL